jgi:3-oxoadipate CoA-transferase alpha subunit
MCTAAKTTIVQTREFKELGTIDPESVVTPGIFVHRVLLVPNPANESKLVSENVKYHGIKY